MENRYKLPKCFADLNHVNTHDPAIALENLERWRSNAIARLHGARRKWFRELENRVGTKLFQNDALNDITPLSAQRIQQLVRAGLVVKVAGGGTRGYPKGISMKQWRPWAWYMIVPVEQRNADRVEEVEELYADRRMELMERRDWLRGALGQVADQQKNFRRRFALKMLSEGNSMTDVAAMIGLTRERIRQFKVDGLRMLKQQKRLAL